MAEYTYPPLRSEDGQFRLLKLKTDWAFDQLFKPKQNASTIPLASSLEAHLLPLSRLDRVQRAIRTVKLPLYHGLSYVWGDPTMSCEILIDGKVLKITKSLYVALRAIQRDANEHSIYVWADAICINQQDLEERSAQVVLMRETYHAATYVRIWLGDRVTKDHLQCIQYIRLLNGDGPLRDNNGALVDIEKDPGISGDSTDEQTQQKLDESKAGRFFEVVGVPIFKTMAVFSGIDKVNEGIKDVVRNPTRDETSKGAGAGLLTSNQELSLLQNRHRLLKGWSPSRQDIEKASVFQGVNRLVIAQLIDTIFIHDCDWFSRMWVVQELACAKNPWIQIGHFSIWWDQFVRTVTWMSTQTGDIMTNSPTAIGLDAIRVGWSVRQRPSLRELIHECRYRKATEPRDKVYALLGLMGDAMDGFLRPNYEETLANVYANTTRHLITQSESLDPICGWQTHGKLEDLASWVPDYSLDQEQAPAPLVPIENRIPDYCASGRYHKSLPLIKEPSNTASNLLNVSGVYIERVEKISYPTSSQHFDLVESSWRLFLLETGNSEIALTSEDKDQLQKIATSIKSIRSSDIKYGGPNTVSEVIRPNSQAYIETLFNGRIAPNQRLHGPRIQTIMSGIDVDSNVSHALDLGTRWRRLAITSSGHLGALPYAARVGDMICVLFGCSVPVVLRERDGGSYEFVGECYLHGFMDGEAIVMLDEGKREVQHFELK